MLFKIYIAFFYISWKKVLILITFLKYPNVDVPLIIGEWSLSIIHNTKQDFKYGIGMRHYDELSLVRLYECYYKYTEDL